jgi:hypothetical protein
MALLNTVRPSFQINRKAVSTYGGGDAYLRGSGMVTLDSADGFDYSTNFLASSTTVGFSIPTNFTTTNVNGINTITNTASTASYLNAAEVLKGAR